MKVKDYLQIAKRSIDFDDKTYDYTICLENIDLDYIGYDENYAKVCDFINSNVEVSDNEQCDFCKFIHEYREALNYFSENNCYVSLRTIAKDYDSYNIYALRLIQDLVSGNYSDEQYKELYDLLTKKE